jgi:hypothetical protein
MMYASTMEGAIVLPDEPVRKRSQNWKWQKQPRRPEDEQGQREDRSPSLSSSREAHLRPLCTAICSGRSAEPANKSQTTTVACCSVAVYSTTWIKQRFQPESKSTEMKPFQTYHFPMLVTHPVPCRCCPQLDSIVL